MSIQNRFKSYVICTAPRSGSTLLCKMLQQTGRAGFPDSHFHRPDLESWMKTYKLPKDNYASNHEMLAATFAAARARGTGDTGMFGLRLQRGSFDFFRQKTAELFSAYDRDSDRIEAAFGKTLFIHLTRPNKIDQAISRVKAEQSGLWHKAADGSEIERTTPPQELHYDRVEIERHVLELTKFDEDWKAWFDEQSIKPHKISYDNLAGHPREILAQLLDELGLDRAIAKDITPPTAKLADEVSIAWAARYRNEIPDKH
ncbi:MAG: Stf0 family sulfotransferase [Hyphomicrobiales bacterium]